MIGAIARHSQAGERIAPGPNNFQSWQIVNPSHRLLRGQTPKKVYSLSLHSVCVLKYPFCLFKNNLCLETMALEIARQLFKPFHVLLKGLGNKCKQR